MTLILQSFIDALRDEMQQLGEMLALLEQHHEEPPDAVAGIGAQRAAIQSARERRQSLQRQLAAGLDQPEAATFAQLVPLLPGQYRPLITALVQENHELLERVEQRGQQLSRLGHASAPAPSPAESPPSAGSHQPHSLVPDAPENTMDPRSSC